MGTNTLSSARGASLLELMAVIVIVCILAAMAMPDMRIFTAGRRLSVQAEELASLCQRARDLAMEQACPWRMLFSPGRGTWLCYGDRDDDARRDPDEKALGPFALEKGITFGCTAGGGPNDTAVPDDGVSFADNGICFSPMGACNAGSIYLTDRRASLAIRLLPASGVVKMWLFKGAWKVLK